MSALTCKMRANLQNGNVIHHTPGMIADRFASCIRTEPFTSIYTVEGDIARGKFGVVRKVRHKCTDQIYAAKFIRKRRRGQDARADILHEIAVHEIAKDHCRLITLHEVFENNHEMVLVLEYAAGGELFNQCVYEDTFKERDVIRLMRQILESLAFLHDRNIVHLDIKPQNILLTNPLPHGDIKLCDFGLARLVDSSTDFREIVGTPDYIAPEILSYEPISTQTDMWSIGVLTYVMLTGCSPFIGASNQETFLNISQVNLDFPDELFEHISPQAKDFICQLLQSDPSDRATARDCLNHPWLWHDNHNHQETILLITSPRCLRRPHPICNDETMEDDVSQPKRAKVDDEFVY